MAGLAAIQTAKNMGAVVLGYDVRPVVQEQVSGITSRGDLRLCLFGNTGISIRHLLQKDEQLDELKDLILKQMKFKKESHYLELGETGLTKNLSTTGG